MHFAEQPVLQLYRGNVVKHRERHGRREAPIRQREFRCIGVHNLNIRKLRGDRRRKNRVDLDGGEMRGARAQKLGGQTWTRTDLEKLIAEICRAEDPRQESALETRLILRRSAEITVKSVHALSLR